ncbi:putative transcription factor C2H2 family [Helianthus anomalus]
MAKVNKVPQRSGSRVTSPNSLRPFQSKITKDSRRKKQKNASEKKEWRDAKCSVCLEYPHNAVLLLCSSHHKGCRSYMCATSYRYSNCLDQYKKAYTKVNGSIDDPSFSSGSDELLCPLCRGQVKGWTVVKRARKFLNSKKRSCMLENCSFVGSYKDLRKHVRADHPSARPREVDPSLAKKWKKLENDRELNDVMSTINSTMPGSIIMGDYVIERNFHDVDYNYLDNVILQLESRNSIFGRSYESFDDDDDDVESEDEIVERIHIPRVARRRQGRVLYGGSRRRRDV